jgi:cytoskeletal protein CcmA (bactofilin family)
LVLKKEKTISNRFHSKFHKANHKTDGSLTYPDGGHDPIASPDSPFLGSFVSTGMISANPSLSSIGGYFNATNYSIWANNNARVVNHLWADSIYTPFLTADDVLVNVINISSYELNGFTISGNDFNLEIPPAPYPFTEGLLLSGVQLSGTGWASFHGSIYTEKNLYVADTAYINNISAHNITADGGMVISGGVDIFGNVNIDGNLNVTEDASAHNLIATNNLYVSGDAYIHTIHLSGDCTIMGTLTSDGTLTATGEYLYLKLNGLDRYVTLYEIS